MFTHIHGTGYEARKKENGCDSLEKIRMSFRILPRYNVQDFTEQLTLEEFKTVKYAICMRQHFQGVDGTYYYLTDFCDNDFQPVFIQKLKQFLKDLCYVMSSQDIYGDGFIISPFEYEAADKRFYMEIRQENPTAKNGIYRVNKCKVCIKSDFWKVKRRSKRISQTFKFSVSNMELRSGLYQFIKENDYEPEPYTVKSDMDSFPGSVKYSRLKMIGKNKPILLVDVRSLFFQEENDYHIFYSDLWNFDEKISEYFEPKYIWSGDEITLSQRRMFCRIHYHLFNTSDFFNPGQTQCFYMARKLNPEFEGIFNQFYAVTFLLYTGKLDYILKIAKTMKETLIATHAYAFRRNYIPVFHNYSNIFEVNTEALNRLHTMELRYAAEYDDSESCDNYVYDNDAPDGLYFSFFKRNDEIAMVGVFPEDKWFYQYWSRYTKTFYDYTGKIPAEIITSPDIWYHEEFDDIDECRMWDEAIPLSFRGMYREYAVLDELDEKEFDQMLYLEKAKDWEDWRKSLTPKDNEWFYSDFYEDEMLFGDTKVKVENDGNLPKNCFVIKC